jgi:tetratricopeptide (TPR) repeat protein
VVEGFRRGMWYRLWNRCNTREDTIYKWLVMESIGFSSFPHVVVESVFLRETQLRDRLDRDKFQRLYPEVQDRVETLDNKNVHPKERHWTIAEYSHNILDYDDYVPLMWMTPQGPTSLDGELEKSLPLSNKLNVALLHGENGTGKTESAMYYCKTRTSTYSGGIYIFNGQDFQSFNASFFHIAKKSSIECDYEDFNDVKEETIKYILKQYASCLLLFDNVDTEEMQKIVIMTLEKLKMDTMHAIHVLITSTISLWSHRGLSIRSFEIEGFMESSDHNIHQAREYLSRTISMQINDHARVELLDELIKLLGTVPLLLSQAATYCQAHPISTFIERYSENWKSQKELLDKESIFGSKVYKKKLYTAWITKVSYVQDHLNNCSSLLHCISFIGSEQIPEIQLLYYFIDETSSAEKAMRIEFLKSQSILHVDHRAGTFRIHRMLQEIIRINLHDIKLYAKSLDDVLSRVSRAFNYNYYETNSYRSAKLIHQHVRVVLERTKELQNDKHYKLLEVLGLYYQEILGQFRVSVNILRDVYAYYNEKHSEYNAIAVINLAGAIRSTADFNNASKWYKKALKLIGTGDRFLEMEVHVYCAQCEQMMYNSKAAIEKFYIAIDFFKKTETNTGTKRLHIDIARTLAFLAGALRKYEGPWFDLCKNRDYTLNYAIKCLVEAQEIYSKWVGEDHDAHAEIFGDIAHTYDDMGDFNSAQVFYEKALVNQKRILDPNHPWVAATHYEYGITLLSIKKPQEAMEQIRIASGIITTETFAGNLYYYVHLLKFYVHDFINQKPEAIHCLESVISSFTRQGMTCEKIVTFRYEISWKREWTDLCESKDVDLEYYISVKKSLEIIYGPRHPEIANCHRRISLVYLNLGDVGKAKKSLKTATNIMKSIMKSAGIVSTEDVNYSKLLSLATDLHETLDSNCTIH